MAKISIEDYNKTLLCHDCGWTGTLGATIGPNQERNFVLEEDEDKDKKDHLYWAIYNNYFCPACFDKKKRTGNIVRRDLLDHGMLSDKERDKLMALDIENKKVQLKAKGIL